jgi:hypothetical protein
MIRQFVLNGVAAVDGVVSVPAELGAIDGAIVRCIAGELSKNSLAWSTRRAGVDAQRRMENLLSRHLNMAYADLHLLPGSERKRMAHYIVTAEMEERETMPGELAALRTFSPSASESLAAAELDPPTES